MQKKQSSDNSVQAFGKLFRDTNEKKNKLFCSRQSNSIYIHYPGLFLCSQNASVFLSLDNAIITANSWRSGGGCVSGFTSRGTGLT